VALKEAALARSSSSSSSEGATPALTDASLVHAAPSDREPLPAGANGNKVIHNIPFQARRLRGGHAGLGHCCPVGLTRLAAAACAPQVLSWNPRAVFFPGFLDEARCKRVVELADARLAPSSLALRAGDTAQNTADIRTSQGTFLTRGDDKEGVLDYLEKRIADVTMLPQRHGEPFNVLRYEVGQKYDSHYDTFDPESYGPQSRRVHGRGVHCSVLTCSGFPLLTALHRAFGGLQPARDFVPGVPERVGGGRRDGVPA
jgi:hypothetical protein